MKHQDARSLPPCAMSSHCLRLADVLDNLVPLTDNPQDQLLVAQLQTHLSTCPTCNAVLAQARRQRNQQRAALRTILREGEQKVPSTVLRIHEALDREAERELPNSGARAKKAAQQSIPLTASRQHGTRTAYDLSEPLAKNRRVVLRNIAAVAVAAVLILAAVGLFNAHFFPSNTGSSHTNKTGIENPATTDATPNNADELFGGWNAALMAIPGASGGDSAESIKNYNFVHNSFNNPGANLLPADAVFDGIAPDGSDLLYQFSQSGHTYYSRFLHPFGNTGFFFELNDQDAGNAIWMPDGSDAVSRYVLIGTRSMGVIKVDTLTGQAAAILPQLVTNQLEFYRNGYLYYIDTDFGLSRVNLMTGVVTFLTSHSKGTSIWLSPDGTTIYFLNNSSSGAEEIYSMNVNGTNWKLLRSSGVPVGFAADNSLLIIRYVSGQFQVIKLGATEQQDQVVDGNAAPGAVSLCPTSVSLPHQICDNFVAMAPYGHALIVQGTDVNGTYHVWLDNLITHTQIALEPTTDTRTAVQLLGWDRLLTH
jgi:hypothetical protein